MYIWRGTSTSAPLRTSECMLGATNACTVGRSGVSLTGWKGTKRTANGPNAAYRLMREAMDPYYSQLDDLSFCHGKETECTWELEEAETEAGRMLSSSTGAHALTKARWSLEQWMRCIPVVPFNGGRYDLQLIKPYLAAVYGPIDRQGFVAFKLMRALNCRRPLTVT